jgi:CheY-like chemotaxis protein
MTDLSRLTQKLAGIRLLIVDDDEGVRSALVDALGLYGAAVTGSDSAADARATLASRRFDVLMSDINMPYEDGCQLMESIRALGNAPARAIGAIAMTVIPEGPLGKRALDAGFDRVVSKLTGIAELVDVIHDLALTKRSTSREAPRPPARANVRRRAERS